MNFTPFYTLNASEQPAQSERKKHLHGFDLQT